MKKITLLILILAAGAGMFHLNQSAFAQTGCDSVVAQNGSGNFTAIQPAIDALKPGQTLCVRSGTYYEVIFIRARQDLTIKNYPGESPVIDGKFQLPDATCKQKDLACISWCYSGKNGTPPNSNCGTCNLETSRSDAIDTQLIYETNASVMPGRNADGTCLPNSRTQGRAKCQDEPLVAIKDSKNIRFEGFEIKNSTGKLMSVAGDSSHTGVKVSNLNMHHTWGSGFGVFNTPDIVVDSVKVWQAKMSFAEACIVGGNGFNINNSTGGTVRNSHVYNNYGEGATSDQSSNIIYKNNYFYDNYHANLHVHGSKGTVVDGNVVYCSTNAPYPFQKRNLGILLADEVKSTQANTSNVGEKRTIINNLVVGCNDGIAIRSQFASKIKDDVFAYNTVVASRPKPGEKADSHSAFSLRPDTSAIVTNSYFGNNLIIQDGGTMCNGLGCTASGLTKENNMLVTLEQGKNYITSPTSVTVSSWPPGQSGSSQGPAMILSNPSNITAEHLKTQFSMQNYQLTSSSLAQKKGKPLAQVSQDLLKQKRPTSGNYAIGAFESSTNNNPPPSGNNAAAADLNADGKVDYADFTLAVSNFGNPYTAFDVNNVITYYKQ